MTDLIDMLHRDFFNLPLISSMHPVFQAKNSEDMVDYMFRRPDTMPAPDIVNFPDRIEINIPAAGYPKELIDVSIADGMLCVTVDRNNDFYPDQDIYYMKKGFSLAGFMWRLRLGQQLVSDDISVRVVDGMIRIAIPKRQKEIKKIPITE